MLVSAAPFLILSLIHIAGEGLRYRPVRYLSKPFLMPALALFYILNTGAPSGLLIAAIAGGWLGDLFLMLPDRTEGKLYFKLGLLSFLLGHLFYAAAFVSRGAFRFDSLLSLAAAVLILVYCGAVFIKLKPFMGKLFIPITAYIDVIALMGIAVTSCIYTQPLNAALTALAGAVIFMISDTLNAWNRFASEIPNERVYTMTTYLAGQFLLVLGFLCFIP
ncbi:MAG: lysoplasmalogenase [Spirochaetales bacterium]|nr:lysoplasmalogenase [Spirochaetales bacterium]